MKDKILEILNKYNGIEILYDFTDTKEKAFENLASPENVATEIESLIKENYVEKEFVKWKDKYTKYCDNGKSPHYTEYYVDVNGVYGSSFDYMWLNLDSTYEYWQTNIKDK